MCITTTKSQCSRMFSQGDQLDVQTRTVSSHLRRVLDCSQSLSGDYHMIMWCNEYGVSPIAAEVEQIAVIRRFG